MTRTQTIIYVAVGLIVALIVGCFAFIPALNGEDPNEGGGGTTDTNISIQVPTDTSDPTDNTDDPTVTPPVIDDNQDGDETDTDTSDTTKPPKDGDPKVEGGTEEEVKNKTPEVNNTEGKDKVVSGEKDKDTVQTGPTSGEDRNDVIIKEKEELAPKTEEEQKDAEVKDEEVKTGGAKGDAIEREEETKTEGGNKNAPDYVPSEGGDNPFDDDTKTEINDKPVEDYVGEGEDRPGGGIQF